MGFNEFKELWGALNQWKVSTELKQKQQQQQKRWILLC